MAGKTKAAAATKRQPVAQKAKAAKKTRKTKAATDAQAPAAKRTKVAASIEASAPMSPTAQKPKKAPGKANQKQPANTKATAPPAAQLAASPKGEASTPDALFAVYADAHTNIIEPEGVERLCQALELDAADRRILLLAWRTQAKRMGFFDKDEWLLGMRAMQCNSITTLKSALDALNGQVHCGHWQFPQLFTFAFQYLLTDETRRIVEMEYAIAMLRAVFPPNTPHVEGFTSYLEQQKQYKTMNKDQWQSFLRFVQEVKPDCSNFDEESAWPIIIDDYVAFLQKSKESKEKAT